MGRRSDDQPIPERGLTDWIPTRGITHGKPWQGTIGRKPWEYEVTAVIPHLDTSELLQTNISLLQAQTIQPYIVIVDTGSSPRHLGVLDEIERMNDGVEVHRLRFKGVVHPSDPVAIAMDLAFSLCSTSFIYATHADCFLKRREYFADMLGKLRINPQSICGYQITDRPGLDTKNWVGHTSTFFETEFVDANNLAWSQRKFCNLTGCDHEGDKKTNSKPDTEFLINWQMDRLQKKGHDANRLIIGTETNYETTDDDNLTHVRSYASSKLYSSEHFAKCAGDMARALKEADERLKEWNQ